MERVLIFDEAEDFDDIYGSKSNESVQITDPKADYISDCLFSSLTDCDVTECEDFRTSFTGLSDDILQRYIQEVDSNAKVGRMKKDYFLPYTSSKRMSERDMINDFATGPEVFWKIGSCFQSSSNEIPLSDLDDMGLGLPTISRPSQTVGSAAIGGLRDHHLAYSKFMKAEDDVVGDISFLYSLSKSSMPLYDHELLCVSSYKPVTDYISNMRVHSYALFIRRLAEHIMHNSRKVGKGMASIRTLGDDRIIAIHNHSNLMNVESGPLCSFVIRMTQDDYELFSLFFSVKILFSNSRGDLYVYVPWRSFDLVDCGIMLKAHYHLLSFPLLFTDSLDDDMNDKVDSLMDILSGLIQCRNSEVFSVLANFRYIMPGVLNSMHSISSLISEKMPKFIRSGFTDFILYGLLDWLSTFKQSLLISDRSKKAGDVSVLDEYDVEFSCKLPYLSFKATNFDHYLNIMYLISMTVGKTKQSRHVYNDLYKVLREWEDKAVEYRSNLDSDTYSYNIDLLGKSCEHLMECTKPSDGSPNDLISKFLRTKGTLDDLSSNFRRLFDRTLYELDHPIHECTVTSLLKKYKPKPEMRMAVRDDHSGEREIFVTSLPAVCALNVIEGVCHTICEQLPSEHITLGGERKVMVMQNEAQASMDVTEKGWVNFLGSEDASKWSTGDNPDILIQIWRAVSHLVPDDLRTICTNYMESLKNRRVLFQDGVKQYINNLNGADHIDLTMGWPQGFFNKISSLKHYLCYCLAIAMFKKRYSGSSLVKIKFAVHSDDSRHRFSIEKKELSHARLKLEYETFLECLYWAKRSFLIRPNMRKSFYGGTVSEYLSHFQFHGSLFVPKSKFILTIFGDLSGAGYPSDTYSVMERVRNCLRMNVGMSLGKFMMNYSSYYVRRLYSMLPDMRGFDSLRVTDSNLVELGGVFSCHPIFLLFLGCKAHDILVHSENKLSMSKLIEAGKDIEDTDETSPSEMYNHFLPIPTASMPNKGSILGVRRRFPYYKLDDDSKWMTLYLEDLSIENASKVARNLLYGSSMAKSYSTAPEGLMYARIQQTWDRPAYKVKDKYLTFWEYVKYVESMPSSDIDIMQDLLRSSPTLTAMLNLKHVTQSHFGQLSRTHVLSSQVNRINILSPGSNEFRYLKYALANLYKLDIVYPDKIDENRLSLETDILEKDVSRIPGVGENKEIRDFPKIYKYLNVRNAKPSYLHLNKHIRDPSSLDLYELASVVLKHYTASVTGKVSLGKISTVHVGEKTFRPENISYKVNRDDEIHTAAKILSLFKIHVSPEEYMLEKEKITVGGKSIRTLIHLHPFRSPHVSYYVDYIFLCQEFDEDVRYKLSILEQFYEDGVIIRLGSNCVYVTSSCLRVHSQIDNNNEFLSLLAFGYLRMYQLRLQERNDWTDIDMPSELVSIAPHLYLQFERQNRSLPALAYHEGRIVFKSGFYNKYLENLEVVELPPEILGFQEPPDELSGMFHPKFDFHNLDLEYQTSLGPIKKRTGIGVTWENLNTHVVGDLAQFISGVQVPKFQIAGKSSRMLMDTRYFARDEIILLKTGVTIPDVSRHRRFNPHLNISDLKKEDFDDLRLFLNYLISKEGVKGDVQRKSLFYKDGTEPETSIYSFFSRSRIHPSQMKLLLSYDAYSVICQNLQPIRCRIEHERSLRCLFLRLCDQYYPKLSSMKRTKYNMVDLVLHASCMIGLLQEVDAPAEGSLTGDDYVQFVKYRSYAGCTSNVWTKMFTLYMTIEDQEDEEW